MKALAINIDTRFNSCLSHKLSQYSCDTRALASYFEKLGYTIYIHSPYQADYKTKQIKTDNIVTTQQIEEEGLNGYDLIFIRILPMHVKMLTGTINWPIAKVCSPILKAMQQYRGTIYNMCVDYRETARHPKLEDKAWQVKNKDRCSTQDYTILKDLFKTNKIIPIVPAPTTVYNNYAIANQFTTFACYNLDRNIINNFNSKKYDYVYAGMAKLSKYRLSRVLELTQGLNCKTVGPSKIKGWDSLSNYKKVMDKDEYSTLVSQGRLSLVVAEPWHNFLTLRYFESYINGNVLIVDSKYTVACKHLKAYGLESRIVNSYKDTHRILSQNLEQLYAEQLETFNRIQNDNRKTTDIQAISLRSVF